MIYNISYSLTLEDASLNNDTNLERGIYIGTKKVKRLFIGKKEISKFISDTEDW